MPWTSHTIADLLLTARPMPTVSWLEFIKLSPTSSHLDDNAVNADTDYNCDFSDAVAPALRNRGGDYSFVKPTLI
jgi:hypothetical protein